MDLLVVEDDDVVGRGTLRLARMAGLQAERVATVEAALARLASTGPETVVLVDVHLARRHGLDLVTALRQRGDRRPVILMSGWPSEQSAAELQRLGVVAFLNKPFDARALSKAHDAAVEALPPS